MTYVYLGHGRDLLTELEVPPGCTLSTIAESGLASDLRSVLNLCNESTINKQMVTHPSEHVDKLYELFSGERFSSTFTHKRMLQEGEYHLTEAGQPYTNKYCDFLFKFERGTHYALLRSGLYNVETPGLRLPILKEGDIYDHVSINIDPLVGITIGNIKQLYHGCVYPDINTILTNIILATREPNTADDKLVPYPLFQEAVKKSVTMNVDGLMETFKGNHYFFVCRTYADDNHSFNTVEARRVLSAERKTRRRRSPLQGSTRKGRDQFKRAIRKMVRDMPIFKTSDYVTVMNMIQMRFKIFIDAGGNPAQRQIDFVNTTIGFINDSLAKRQFTIDDMRDTDPTFVEKLAQTQAFSTALRFVES